MSTNLALFNDYYGGDALGASHRQIPPSSVASEEYDQKRSVWHTQLYKYSSPARRLVINVGGQAPQWMPQLVERLTMLSQLPSNWDSYGAEHIKIEAISTCVQFMGRVMIEELRMPDIVPTSSGGLQLEWHLAGIDFELEIDPEGKMTAGFEDLGDPGAAWEEDLGGISSTDFSKVIAALNKIQERTAR